MNWKTIDSAPRDGTRILVFRKGYAEHTAVAFYRPCYEDWELTGMVPFPGITHWMPLPEPPEE